MWEYILLFVIGFVLGMFSKRIYYGIKGISLGRKHWSEGYVMVNSDNKKVFKKKRKKKTENSLFPPGW